VHGLLETGSRSQTFLLGCCRLHGAATDWLPIDHTTFVVAHPKLVMSEEHLADKVPPAPYTCLLEHPLEILLHSVGRDTQIVRNLRRGVTTKHQPRYLLRTLCQPEADMSSGEIREGWPAR
jgi:hypothetical protein